MTNNFKSVFWAYNRTDATSNASFWINNTDIFRDTESTKLTAVDTCFATCTEISIDCHHKVSLNVFTRIFKLINTSQNSTTTRAAVADVSMTRLYVVSTMNQPRIFRFSKKS